MIKALLLQDGSMTRDQKKIMQEQIKIHKKLYKSNPLAKFTYKNDFEIKVTQIQKEELDKEITCEEITLPMKGLKNSKTPGLDGHLAELYKVLWEKMGIIVFEAIKFAQQQDVLHKSALKGVVGLTPKKDRDPKMIKNWRPLTMLNTDYKIFARVLALRMKVVPPFIIGDQQTGYMQNRFIGVNIRKLIDTIWYVEEERISALLINIC